MAKSKVYFIDIKTDDSLLNKLGKGFTAVNNGQIGKDEFVALKAHFGEYGNTGFVRPIYSRTLIESIKKVGAKPFITDTNTLYVGMRWNATEHLECALKNGFSYATIGAPIIVADGLRGHDYRKVDINGKHFKETHIASAIVEADSMVVLSHFKGHMASGFGGALKNLGMGCASRAGKQQQHSTIKPKVDKEKCVACMLCSEWCQVQAITKNDGKADIDPEICVGCGECTVACKAGAIGIRWDANAKDFEERMVEYGLGAIKGKEDKSLFFNFLMDITPDCDCFPKSDAPVVPNIGILISADPVAIDQASYDMVQSAMSLVNSRLEGIDTDDKFKELHNLDPTIQLSYAEEIGLGCREYDLIKI